MQKVNDEGFSTKFEEGLNSFSYFGFIQLSTWCQDSELIAEMRTIGQMSALKLPKVGYATNADHGAGCYIRPPSKQYCAQRRANRLHGSRHPSSPPSHRSPRRQCA